MSTNKKFDAICQLITDGLEAGELEDMAFTAMIYDKNSTIIHTNYFIDKGVNDLNFIRGTITVLNHIKDNPRPNGKPKSDPGFVPTN